MADFTSKKGELARNNHRGMRLFSTKPGGFEGMTGSPKFDFFVLDI